ncbi:hypothetical protein OIO90_006148 [Microbotryomycetes sp. JL221]|nr:hypothetical protein OIO90_006148 [Microbotryomycetes sp. JL221]
MAVDRTGHAPGSGHSHQQIAQGHVNDAGTRHHGTSTNQNNPSRRSPLPSPIATTPLIDAEKRDLLAEEGHFSSGPPNGHVFGDDTGSSKRSTGRVAGHSYQGAHDAPMDWHDLWNHASNAGKQWKRVWDRDGWQGRILVLVTAFFILVILRISGSSDAARVRAMRHSNSALDFLTGPSPGIARSPINQETRNKAKTLESFTNPYGFINLIDPYAGGVFNPSVLVLPDTAGVGFRHLVVARGPEKYEVINGEDTRWESVLGCFLTPLERAHLALPYLARESELETLDLPAQRKVEYLRCHDPTFDQFIGPEDPRLFFTNDGQPLLLYSQTGRSPNICRAIFMIDARVVIPGLTDALKRAGWNPPIVFKEQTDLIRENQFNIEKNWAPFLGEQDELFFHVSLVPQEIYKWVPGLTLRALDPSPPTHNCLTEVIGAEMNRVKFHHATPLLRVTLCKRGECKPSIHNTVLFGIIHIKYHPLPYLFYERRVVTWNVTSPYEYLSVSKPLTYSGTNQADPIFTVSMAWDHPSSRHGLGLNHGFLDDIVLISFGVYDYGSAYIDVQASALVSDHTLCAPSHRIW